MIYLGVRRSEKHSLIQKYIESCGINRVVVLSPIKFDFQKPSDWETIDWPQIIKYQFFYRLLREIDANTLVVVNECLRTQKRSDLTLNCIRHFLSQTQHAMVFQWLPLIDTIDDTMTLVDFATKSRFKGLGWKNAPVDKSIFRVTTRTPNFIPQVVPIASSTVKRYEQTREKLFSTLGSKDPHTLPRNLHLVAGQEKAKHTANVPLVGRNDRYSLADMATYKDDAITHGRTVFEFPHNFIDMADFCALAEQTEIPCLTTELKVDAWYVDRFMQWSGRIKDAYAEILG